MDKKRILASVVVFLILAILVYLQYRHWRSFDWGTFWSQIHRIKKIHVLHGIVLVYAAYVCARSAGRSFCGRCARRLRTIDLVSPMMVGFTGLALLGRAGEFIRPYLVARRADLSFSSQLAVWAVERMFDVGAFAVLIVLAIFLPSALAVDSPSRILPAISRRRICSGRGSGHGSGSRGHDQPQRRSHRAVDRETIRASVLRLGTPAGAESARVRHRAEHYSRPCRSLWLALLSVGIWYVTALAYKEVTHSYGVDALEIPVSQLLILMGASMVGSMLQLPAVGGGSQMATIATLSACSMFLRKWPPVAASCSGW